MEVVHVIRQYPPSVGGLEDVVRNLCGKLSQMPGVHVRVVTLDRIFSAPAVILPAEEVIDGIEVTRIPWFGSTRYPLAFGVMKTIQTADIVHVHAIDFFFDFLAWTQFLHHKPLVASTHGGFFHTRFAARLKKIFFQTVTRLSCRAYRYICASSENDANTFSRISQGNIITIENGVNVEKWHDCGSKSAERTMIFIGRWSRNKRVPLLIALVSELRKLGTDWRLHIVGLPSDDDMNTLQATVRKLQVEDAVHIHISPGEDGIRQLITSASYIVSASDYEGFGISIVEGLSAGLVPLLSPIPPFERLLKELEFGGRIDPSDLMASAVSIEAFHQTLVGDTQTLRNRCMTLAKHYAWDDVALRFLSVYEDSLGIRHG